MRSFAEQLAEHLIARQAILERYIDLCPIPCFILNKDGETIFINEAYQQAYNVRLDQVDKRQWEQLVAPEDREKYVAEFDRFIGQRRSSFFTSIRTLTQGVPVDSIVRVSHVPGNGYIGYILFQCSNNGQCPVRNVIDNYLSHT